MATQSGIGLVHPALTRAHAARQGGAALLIALTMLIAILLLGAAAVRMALLEEKASRAGRTHLFAQQAAEAALARTERELPTILENAAPAASTSGKETTETTNTPADLFPAPGICTSAGLCRPAAPGASPVWSNIGQAPLPSVLIELIELTSPVKHAGTSPQSTPPATVQPLYRISALGIEGHARVLLQSLYRPPPAPGSIQTGQQTGRLAWREMLD